MLSHIHLIINLYLINEDDEEKYIWLQRQCNRIFCLHYKTSFCTDSTLWYGSLEKTPITLSTLQSRHNDCDCVSNHRRLDCFLNRLLTSMKTPKFRVTGLCTVTGEFPALRTSNAENVSIWWRHYELRHTANVDPDLCRHMVSWSHNELKYITFALSRCISMLVPHTTSNEPSYIGCDVFGVCV